MTFPFCDFDGVEVNFQQTKRYSFQNPQPFGFQYSLSLGHFSLDILIEYFLTKKGAPIIGKPFPTVCYIWYRGIRGDQTRRYIYVAIRAKKEFAKNRSQSSLPLP